jgi:hypothetical protein
MAAPPTAQAPARPNQIPPDRRAPASLNSGADVGEYISVAPDPEEPQIEATEDGGAFVSMPGEEKESTPSNPGFYANLAETLPLVVQSRIVTDLLRHIEDDKKSRELRDKQYAEGLRRTGMGKDAPGGASFEGASKVVHPMMTEACIDYESRIIKEIFPPSGPVKPHILGAVTTEKTERAKRKTEHMNWQLTTQIKEARSVMETTLTQVPLGGSQFIHQWMDHRLKRPRWEFRSVDKMHIPFAAADFASATRKTYEDRVTAIEFRQRVDHGMYVDTELAPPSQQPDPSKSQSANDKIEGLEDPGQNLDGDRTIYETMTYLEVSEEMAELLADQGGPEKAGELCPYLISTDESTKTMLGMYRCWEDRDEAREPIEHDFEFPFLPWRGALSIGFPQVIGGLSAAATGALRALLDSAHVNTTLSGLIKKGSGASGQSRSVDPGTLVEIDVGLETTDIRQAVMPFPFNPPSPVLFQLLGFVVEAAKGIVRTSLDESPIQGNTNVPVGTQMSRVEEGLVVFSAIHGRAHAALNRLLIGLHRLNRLYLPEILKVDAAGRELMVRRSDYEGPCDIQPVSDPTIYSDQQRFAQLGYIQSRMMVNPALWKAREVELVGLKLVKWPDPETLLADAPQPHELNQVNECLAMTLGQPVTVFPEQDHMAHLHVLMDFMKSPVLGSNPLLAPVFLPAALRHAAQHIAFYYVQQTVQAVEAAAKVPVHELLSNDTNVKAQFDGLLATASGRVVPGIESQLAPVMPLIQQAMAAVKALTPPPPMDPALAAVQAAGAETQRKGAADQADAQVQAGKLQLEQQANAIAASRVAAMREGQQIAAQSREATTAADNQTAMDIQAARTESGQGGGFTNGESMTRQ